MDKLDQDGDADEQSRKENGDSVAGKQEKAENNNVTLLDLSNTWKY